MKRAFVSAAVPAWEHLADIREFLQRGDKLPDGRRARGSHQNHDGCRAGASDNASAGHRPDGYARGTKQAATGVGIFAATLAGLSGGRRRLPLFHNAG